MLGILKDPLPTSIPLTYFSTEEGKRGLPSLSLSFCHNHFSSKVLHLSPWLRNRDTLLPLKLPFWQTRRFFLLLVEHRTLPLRSQENTFRFGATDQCLSKNEIYSFHARPHLNLGYRDFPSFTKFFVTIVSIKSISLWE